VTTNEDFYDQACADVERTKSRDQEVDDLVRRINSEVESGRTYSKMDLIPLMASWVERGRELADLREVVARITVRLWGDAK
jgi:hypothetical protein